MIVEQVMNEDRTISVWLRRKDGTNEMLRTFINQKGRVDPTIAAGIYMNGARDALTAIEMGRHADDDSLANV